MPRSPASVLPVRNAYTAAQALAEGEVSEKVPVDDIEVVTEV